MLEWLKRHAWKACKPLKGFTSSNLVLSAKIPYRAFCEGFFVKSVPKNVPKIRFRGSPSLDLLQGSRSRCEADRSASPGLLISPAPLRRGQASLRDCRDNLLRLFFNKISIFQDCFCIFASTLKHLLWNSILTYCTEIHIDLSHR